MANMSGDERGNFLCHNIACRSRSFLQNGFSISNNLCFRGGWWWKVGKVIFKDGLGRLIPLFD